MQVNYFITSDFPNDNYAIFSGFLFALFSRMKNGRLGKDVEYQIQGDYSEPDDHDNNDQFH